MCEKKEKILTFHAYPQKLDTSTRASNSLKLVNRAESLTTLDINNSRVKPPIDLASSSSYLSMSKKPIVVANHTVSDCDGALGADDMMSESKVVGEVTTVNVDSSSGPGNPDDGASLFSSTSHVVQVTSTNVEESLAINLGETTGTAIKKYVCPCGHVCSSSKSVTSSYIVTAK